MTPLSLFHRPNTQLVKEFEKLLDADLGRFTKMAAPLAIAHLVRMTCERAGNFRDPEQIQCVREFASGYVNKVFDLYKAADNKADKAEKLAILMNIRYGGQSTILKVRIAVESKKLHLLFYNAETPMGLCNSKK